MRKKHYPHHMQPSLFDDLDSPDFEIIPPEKISEASSELTARQEGIIDEMPALDRDNRIFFMSFGSGSSGNCAYIGDRDSGFLIDAGIDSKKVLISLRDNGILPEMIKGIILTHDHHDHIAQAYPMLRANRHMRLFCTPRALNGILRRRSVSRRIKDYHTPIYKEFPFQLGNFTVTPFEVMHDGADNVGFFITHPAGNIAVATDLGCISDRVDHYMRQAQTIVIEANYDYQKLVHGSYPEYLKARILTDRGHLDNTVTGAFLSEIYTPALRNVMLCHLSHDNNTPALAVGAIAAAFAPLGITQFAGTPIKFDQERSPLQPVLAVIPLPRYEHTPLWAL